VTRSRRVGPYTLVKLNLNDDCVNNEKPTAVQLGLSVCSRQ